MFLDTANVKDINEGLQLGFIRGVTTNPTLLLEEGGSRAEQMKKIQKTDTPLFFVQLIGDTVDELLADYKKIKETKTTKEFGIKVPLNFNGLAVIHQIKQRDPKQIVLGTGIYSADQGIMGALAGCDYIAPYFNRMENNNLNAMESIRQMRTVIDDRRLSTQIMGASFRNTNQVIDALMAGAHTVTISMDILKGLTNKQLALSGIEVFNQHGRILAKKNQ